MNSTFHSSVEVYEFDRVSTEDVVQILKKYASPGISLGSDAIFKTAVVSDTGCIPERDRIIEALGSFTDLALFNNVESNPRTTTIMEMFAAGAGFTNFDVVLGIGGGSVLDSAKALAMLAANGGTLEEYLGPRAKRTITNAPIPLVLIPTTSGTGSEVTHLGVYTSTDGRKYALSSPLMKAKAAILSGFMLTTIPPDLCASAGFDALSHALESIWNKNATNKTLPIAEEAAVEVLTWLPKLYASAMDVKNSAAPTDDFAKLGLNMLKASCMAGVAFSLTRTAAVHAISFVLSDDWLVPHGIACAFNLLDIFDLAIAEDKTVESLARISARLHPDINKNDQVALIDALRERIADMKREMKIPNTFAELGLSISKDEIDLLFSHILSDTKMLNQIPSATKENIYPILENKC